MKVCCNKTSELSFMFGEHFGGHTKTRPDYGVVVLVQDIVVVNIFNFFASKAQKL
jgi:hypothetical protein